MATKSTKKITPKTNKKMVKKAAPAKTVNAVSKETAVKAVPSTTSAKTEKPKKVYQISSFFHAMIVLMVVILYAELTFLGVLYYNYEITIESKASIEARQYRAQQQRKMEMIRWATSRSRQARMRTTNAKTGKVVRPSVKCPEPVARKVAFVEAEYAPYAGQGNAVIAGNACFTLADGSEKCFEGIDVFINPVTSYSDEWYNRGWAGREFLAPADKRAVSFNKTVKTGKNGAFTFEGLKPGAYYVGTMVCLPQAKDNNKCRLARFASKVKMKNRVNTTLKKVYP